MIYSAFRLFQRWNIICWSKLNVEIRTKQSRRLLKWTICWRRRVSEVCAFQHGNNKCCSKTNRWYRWVALLVWSYLSDTAWFVFYGIACLMRLIEIATAIVTFEEHVCETSSGTPSPPIKNFDFRGFDSSRLLILRGGNSHVRWNL